MYWYCSSARVNYILYNRVRNKYTKKTCIVYHVSCISIYTYKIPKI